MKKSLIIVCLATCFSLIGGNNVSSPILKNINYAATTSQSPDELTKAYQLLELNIDTTKIVSDIRLPHTGLYSTSITWASSDTSVITIEVSKADSGKVSDIIGKVSQDSLVDKNVRLTATITYELNGEKYSVDKAFDLTVLRSSNSKEEDLPLAFNEDFNSYKTGIDIGNYFKYTASGNLGLANIKESVVNNVNLPIKDKKMLEIKSSKLSTANVYTTKINANNTNVTSTDSTGVKKVAFEFYTMFEGDTNGVEISLNGGTNKAFGMTLSSSGNSFIYNSQDYTYESAPKEGIWNKYRVELTLSGYVKLYQYDFSNSSYKEITTGLGGYNSSAGVMSNGNSSKILDSLKIKILSGTKNGYTYISDIKFDNIVNLPKEETISNPNRDLGIGLVKDYPEEVYYYKGDTTTFNTIPEFKIENRFDNTKILTKGSDYTVSNPVLVEENVGAYKLTTKTFTITLTKYNEIKEVKQYFYESNVGESASIVNFKASYLKQDSTITTKARITLSGNVYQANVSASYLILNKNSTAPSVNDIKSNASVDGKVDGGNNIELTSSTISIDTNLIDISKEYDAYLLITSTNGDSIIYSAKEISTVVNISSVEDLYDMTINESTKGSTFRLINDIDCSSYDWKFSADTAISFAGVLDGQGHTISNLLLVSTDAKTALFKELKGTVKNINFDSCYTSGSGDSCILAGQVFGGTIENVTVTNSKVITNPDAEGSEGYYAILVGRFRGEDTVSTVKNVNIIDCEIDCNKYVGLLTGGVGGSSQDVTVNMENIYAQGKINTEGAAVGLIGRNRAKTNITNAVILLEVTFAKKEVGAVAGHNKEGGKIVANNILSDLKIKSMTQPTYFNNFIGSHDANTSSYSGSNVNYIAEDYSDLGDSITPTKTAISFGDSISYANFSSQSWWEKNTFLRDLDTNLDWSFDTSLSRPIVKSKDESKLSFTTADYKQYIDMLDGNVSTYRYPLYKASNVYKYLSSEDKTSVADLKAKYDQCKTQYEEYIKQIEDTYSSSSSIVDINL